MSSANAPHVPWPGPLMSARAVAAFVAVAVTVVGPTTSPVAGAAATSGRSPATVARPNLRVPAVPGMRAVALPGERQAIGHRGAVSMVAVGGDPQMALLDPLTRTLYVDNSADNTVSVIDASTCNAENAVHCGKAAPTVTVPQGAGSLALDLATRTLYVTGNNVVSMVNAATCNARDLAGCNQTPLTAPVGQLPLSIAVNQTTETVYVANAADNDLSVIDAMTCNAQTITGCSRKRTLDVGNFPGVGAIDEETDTVYVNNNGENQQNQNDTVSVVNGATCNAHIGWGCGQSPPQVTIGFGNINDSVGVVLVRATHTLYVTNGGDNTISMIDTAACNASHTAGCSKTAAIARVGSAPQGVGADLALHTIYVANSQDDTLSVLDGATCNATRTTGCADQSGAVRTGQGPIFVANDGATHTMYVVDIDGRDVSVINGATCDAERISGCTHFPPTAATGAGPGLLAVNDKTHTIYVTNYLDNTVSVINAATCNDLVTAGCARGAPVVNVGAGPASVAINAATDSVYVANADDNTISVIDAATCRAADTSGCAQTPPVMDDAHDPLVVVVDQASDTVYASNADGTVSVFDGARCRAGVTSGCNQSLPTVQASTHAINDMTLNPVTHTLYATTLHDGTVSVINATTCNATVTTGCSEVPPTVTVGPRPLGVRVDQRTNSVYVSNIFTDTGFGNTLSVFNGATCDASDSSGCGQTPVTVTVGLGPSNMAIDQATDAVYVVNGGDYSVSVIDGSTCNASRTTGCRYLRTIQVGGGPDGIDIGSTTHTAYVANFNDNDLSIFGPALR
jgi:YVTN family beta-propeller protein